MSAGFDGIRFFWGERVDLSEFVVLQRSTYPVLTTLHQAVHRSLASLLEPNPKGGGKLLLLRVYCCIFRVSVVISVVVCETGNLLRSIYFISARMHGLNDFVITVYQCCNSKLNFRLLMGFDQSSKRSICSAPSKRRRTLRFRQALTTDRISLGPASTLALLQMMSLHTEDTPCISDRENI